MTKARRWGWVASVVILAPACLFVFAQESLSAGKPVVYTGVAKCKTCHKKKKSGDQYTKWMEKKHSKAYASLAGEKAKKVAAEKGIKDPQKAAECLRCHTTAYDPVTKEKRKDVAETLKIEEGVSCESCHGPGSIYKKLPNMKSTEKFLATGGILPKKEVCVKCHNEESPTFKPFDFKERSEKIAHPTPKK